MPGRSGKAYADWLRSRGNAFTAGIGTATLDPFRGYGNAIRDEFQDATAVLDAFHVVQLGLQAMEETRRRVQQELFGHRGRKHDPLYRIRNALRAGTDKLTARQIERIEAGLQRRRPQLRGHRRLALLPTAALSVPRPRSLPRAAIAISVLDSFPSCPIPEIARLGRTLQAWREQFLAYFTTGRANNGGTEAINGIIELHRRIARGFRNPTNYRLRMILAAGQAHPPKSPMSHKGAQAPLQRDLRVVTRTRRSRPGEFDSAPPAAIVRCRKPACLMTMRFNTRCRRRTRRMGGDRSRRYRAHQTTGSLRR